MTKPRVEGSAAHHWPLTPIVRLQLCLAAVWGPLLLALPVMAAIEAVGLAVRGWRPDSTEGPLLLAVAIVPGALGTAVLVPRVWPAAQSLSRRSRITAALLGAFTFQGLAVSLYGSGLVPSEGSVDPLLDLPLVLVCTAAGATVAWQILRNLNRTAWRGAN